MSQPEKKLWTPDDVAVIREMAATHNVSDIAARLGRTRNMVISKASRESIPLTKFNSSPLETTWPAEDVRKLHELAESMTTGEIAKAMGRSRSAIAYKARAEKLSLAAIRIPVEPAFPPAPEVDQGVWEKLPHSAPVPVEDHKAGCRWPIGTGPILFCNCATKSGSPYCEAHAARSFRPAPLMTKKREFTQLSRRFA